MAGTRGREATARPKAIDCFAGCGGMTAGFKQAGYQVVGAIEIDEQACQVFSLNHPEVKLWPDDIRDVEGGDLLKRLGLKVGELDLLGGCPPCQGFSTLRTYNGRRRIRDKQNDLIFEFQRIILSLLPKRVMLENVPGLLADKRLAQFRAALESAGYTFETKILDVADFGVPQRRRRLVALAARDGEVHFAKAAARQINVKEAIGNLPKAGRSGDKLHDIPENRSHRTREVIAAIPRNGGSRSALPKRLQLKCHQRSDGFKDVYGRMAWNRPAPTITTGCFNPSKGRFLHPTENRAITMREAALLQSFPRTYKFPAELGKVCIASMIGNALPPEFIRRHAKLPPVPARTTSRRKHK